MKKTLFICLFLKTLFGYSVILPLTIKDSIINPLIFANNFSKKIYGRSALFTSGNKKFIIGVFDSNHNDTLDERDVVSISELKTKNSSLYNCADKMNSIYAKKLKFILIEKRAYKISGLSLDEINVELTNARDEIKEYNFINCLLTINQFNGLFMDANGVELDSTQLNLSNGKPTIIYYTTLHCPPCEKLKPLITQAMNSKAINLIIVSSDANKGNNDLDVYKKMYYFNSQTDQSKVWNNGFPQILVFDKNGRFMESDNFTRREELISKYAFPD